MKYFGLNLKVGLNDFEIQPWHI